MVREGGGWNKRTIQSNVISCNLRLLAICFQVKHKTPPIAKV